MQWWVVENPDALVGLPCISEWEMNFDYATLDHCQQAREKVEKETRNSLAICAQLHKVVHILMHKGNLPPIEALGKTKTDENIFKEIHQNMKQRKEDA
jgi:hypothetical protein